MWRLVGLLAAAALGVGCSVAAAHQSGCHSHHSCPSDHHTYVWYGAGGAWSCAEPGAPEYDQALDATTITYDGYTYYCRSEGSAPPADTTTTTATTTTTTAPP